MKTNIGRGTSRAVEDLDRFDREVRERHKKDIARATKLGREGKYGEAADELIGVYEEVEYDEAATKRDAPQEYTRHMQPLYNAAIEIVNAAERKGEGNNPEIKNLRTYMSIVKSNISSRGKKSKLEKNVSATATIIGLIGGIFFLSSNVTGNVIGGLAQTNSNAIGAVLLIVGLVAGFFWTRK